MRVGKIGWHGVEVLAIAAALCAGCGGHGSSSSGSGPGTGTGTDAGTSTLVAFGTSASTVNLLWTPAAGATGYKLERQSSGGAFEVIQSLDTSAISFLDRNLAAQTSYSYRLTALGATQDAVRQYSATTSDVAPLQTQDDVPVGPPVQQTIGSTGGTVASSDGGIQLTIPAGAVPDGTRVTLQTVANPLPQELAPAVSILSDVPFAKPVDLRFQLGNGDSPETASVALQDADGLWFTAPATVDATVGTLTVTLAADAAAAPRPSRKAGSAPRPRRVFRFARFYVYPKEQFVRPGGQANVYAYALFSTDACDSHADPDACAWAIEFQNILKKGEGRAVAEGLILPLPAHLSKPVANSLGVWSLEPAGDASGSLVIPADGNFAIYHAPAVKPQNQPVTVRFTPKLPPEAPQVFSDPGQIFFAGNKFRLTANFDSGGIGLNEAITALVTDSFVVDLELVPNGTGHFTVKTSALENKFSTYDHAHCNDPTVISFDLGCCYEAITVTFLEAVFDKGTLSLSLEGYETLVPVTLHYPGGLDITFPGGTNDLSPSLEAKIDLENLVETTTVETTPATGWTFTVKPLPL